MAEVQIIPAAFNPATELPQQSNAGATNGGVATEVRDPANVVQNVQDLVDLNADGRGNPDAETAQDRRASENLTTADDQVQVRVDYDVEDARVYIEFVDPRTDDAFITVPRRDNFDFAPDAIRALAEAEPAPVAVAQAPVAVAPQAEERNPAPQPLERLPEAEIATQAVNIAPVSREFEAPQEVRSGTQGQQDILDNR